MFVSMIRLDHSYRILSERRTRSIGLFIAANLIAAFAAEAFSGVHDNKADAVPDDFMFAALGDWHCSDNTNSTVVSMNAKQPERVLGLGDYSYTATMKCWHNTIEALGPTWVHAMMHDPTSVALGNHENETDVGCNCPTGSHLSPTGRKEFLTHFGFNSARPTYYSFEQKSVHFLVLDANIRSEIGSPQYVFVSSDLSKASKNQSINWIVVYFHQPMYTSGITESSCSSSLNMTSMRNTYQPLFDMNRVDLVVQGHIHAYERMKPMVSGAIITNSTNAVDYIDPRGQIFVTAGQKT